MKQYSREIIFESVENFRDLGGYNTSRGQKTAWRRLFRSGDFRSMTPADVNKLQREIGLVSVIDLRSDFEINHQGSGLIAEAGFNYRNIAFIADGGDMAANERRYRECTNMGEFYLQLIRQKEFGSRIVEALEIIANPENHPLVFHCAVGKDRTGILAAVLLSILGVADKYIIDDYALSEAYMTRLMSQLETDPKMAEGAKGLPDYFWKASPESMFLFLSSIRKEYGSIKDYLEESGAETSLVSRLEKTLLV